MTVELGRIASSNAPISERAPALVAALRRIMPFQASGLVVFDPQRSDAIGLVNQGYGNVRDWYDSRMLLRDVELLGLHRPGPPVCVRDIRDQLEQVPVWTEVLYPSGLRDGVNVVLGTPDGRCVGLLTLHSDTEGEPTGAVRDFIAAIAPLLTNAVDPVRSLATMARMISGAQAGVTLSRDGLPGDLPGLPAHPLLSAGSIALVAAQVSIAGGQLYRSFLCPDPVTDGHQPFRITVLACPSGAPYNLVGAVLLAPAGDLDGLTPRELEIIGMLVEGWSNRHIASALFLSEHTVAAHLEHILVKLEVPTRTMAAVRALRLGHYVPRLISAAAQQHGRRGRTD